MGRTLVLCGLLLGAGCQTVIIGKDASDGPNVDGEGDTDTDADADTDTDTDSGIDTDSDIDTTDTGTTLDCEADYSGSVPAPGDLGLGTCVTQTLSCGDRILGTLAGGSTIYDYDYWYAQGALGPYLGQTTFLDGAERVYLYEGLLQGDTVELRVQTCFDSWATWVRYGQISSDFCSLDPFEQGGIWEIGSSRDRSTIRINPSATSGYDFEFQIEGVDGAEGNYLLTVDCR